MQKTAPRLVCNHFPQDGIVKVQTKRTRLLNNCGCLRARDVNIISMNSQLVRVQLLRGLLKDVAKHIAELKVGVAKVTKTGQDPGTATEAELQGRRSDKTILVRQQTVEVPLSQILKEKVKEGRSPTFERVQQRTAEQVVDEPKSPARDHRGGEVSPA